MGQTAHTTSVGLLVKNKALLCAASTGGGAQRDADGAATVVLGAKHRGGENAPRNGWVPFGLEKWAAAMAILGSRQ
jgi:hypothetical protein